eukprot:2791172-Rhodomonas_salina.1
MARGADSSFPGPHVARRLKKRSRLQSSAEHNTASKRLGSRLDEFECSVETHPCPCPCSPPRRLRGRGGGCHDDGAWAALGGAGAPCIPLLDTVPGPDLDTRYLAPLVLATTGVF